jgi:hypothetical protein
MAEIIVQQFGEGITPQQVILDIQQNEHFAEADLIVVYFKTKDDDLYTAWSQCRASDLALAGVVIQSEAMQAVK